MRIQRGLATVPALFFFVRKRNSRFFFHVVFPCRAENGFASFNDAHQLFPTSRKWVRALQPRKFPTGNDLEILSSAYSTV